MASGSGRVRTSSALPNLASKRCSLRLPLDEASLGRRGKLLRLLPLLLRVDSGARRQR